MAIEIETTIINVTITTDSPIEVKVPQLVNVVGGGLDVEITNPQDGDELYFDNATSLWKNKRGKVILTQAEYDLLTPDPDILYYIIE